MSENPFQAICKTCESLSVCLQSHLSRFIDSYALQPSDLPRPYLLKNPTPPLFSFSAISPQLQPKLEDENQERNSERPISPLKGHATGPVTKEELGRATWTFLHTLAAQFPDHPTKQQKRDVKELMAILSRLYPCKECADHFKEVLKANPVQAGSQSEFSQWLCHVHNVVNRSLGKVIFPCSRVDARWGYKHDVEETLFLVSTWSSINRRILEAYDDHISLYWLCEAEIKKNKEHNILLQVIYT